MNVAIQVISLTRILIQKVSKEGIYLNTIYSCRQVWTGGTLIWYIRINWINVIIFF